MTAQNGVAPSLDVDVHKEIDRVESLITSVNNRLTPSYWKAARTTPATAMSVAESIEELVDLHYERDAIRERAEVVQVG